MANNLKAVRKSRGMTQKEVASELGVALSTYQKYEQGQRKLVGDTIAKLADILETTTDTILGSQFADEVTMSLDPSEIRLIEAFRSLNLIGRNALLTNADALLSSEFMTKQLDDYPVHWHFDSEIPADYVPTTQDDNQ